MTIYEKLDAVLSVFKKSKKNLLEIHDFNNLNIDRTEIEDILNKLKKDEYIVSMIDGSQQGNLIFGAVYYSITFEGRFFEGYKKKKDQEKYNFWLKKIEVWILILGGLFAILYYSMELLQWFFK